MKYKYFGFIIAFVVLPSLVFAKADTGIPYNVPSVAGQDLRVMAIGDAGGTQTLLLDCGSGTCKLPITGNINVSVSSNNSIVVDEEGDTVNYRLAPVDTGHVTVSPGNSTTVNFSCSDCYRITVSSTQEEFRYTFNSSSADTFDQPLTEFQPATISNGNYTRASFYVPSDVSNNAIIRYRAEN